MKKWLFVFVVVAVMTALTASGAMASSVYLERFISGDSEMIDNTGYEDDYDGDAKGTLLGLEFQKNAFKGGFEFLSGDLDIAGQDIDLTSYSIKGGYRVLDKNVTSIDITLGYYKQTFDNRGNEMDIDGIMLGADFGFKANEKLSFLISPAFSLNGKYSDDDSDEDAFISTLHLKGNYLFTDNFGGSLSFRSYLNDIDEVAELNTGGLTVGVFFKF